MVYLIIGLHLKMRSVWSITCVEKSDLNSLGKVLSIGGAPGRHYSTVFSIPQSLLTSFSNYITRTLVFRYGETCFLGMDSPFTCLITFLSYGEKEGKRGLREKTSSHGIPNPIPHSVLEMCKFMVLE